ncbi:stromal cell-derived factor 2 isoform X1 [Hydra vulgaris]|nr:stromal cell-derived factor 2-like [Hydra vulgaris]
MQSEVMNLKNIIKLCTISFFLKAIVLNFAECKNDFQFVTCGSVLKLFNQRQGVRLHSHDVKYGGGGSSGQQSVTGSTSSDDHNSYWHIRGKHKESCERGRVIKCGDTIRLQHLATKRNLHSHLFQSPISHNQEVSAFGEDGNGDTGDNWEVKCSGKNWSRNEKVRFKHIDTGSFLHASAEQYGRPISGQHEICAYRYEDPSNQWIAQEGIYLKERL